MEKENMIYDFPCRSCGKMTKEEVNEETKNWPGALDMIAQNARCPECRVKLQEELNEAARKRHLAKMNAILDQRLERSRLPRELLDYDEDLGNKKLLCFIRIHPDRSLFIADDTGIGKTRAVVWAAWKLLQENPRMKIRYWRITELFRHLAALYSESKAMEAERLIKELGSVDLAIFDDVGKENLTESRAEALYDIIDARYYKKLPFWITSQMEGQQLEARLGEDRGAAILRRMREQCEVWKGDAE